MLHSVRRNGAAPIFSLGAAAWARALNTRGRLRRAYQSAFCLNDKQNSWYDLYSAGTPSANCGASWLIGLDFAGSAAPFMAIASS